MREIGEIVVMGMDKRGKNSKKESGEPERERQT